MEHDKVGYLALAGLMRALKASEGWGTYIELLGDAENRWIQRLLGENRDSYDYNKGIIEGLRLAYHLPDQIIAKSELI